VARKLFPAATPAHRAPRRLARGRCRAEQWWSFIVSLVSSKRMTCSSAMYSDTATLTLKYHIWRHITIRLDATIKYPEKIIPPPLPENSRATTSRLPSRFLRSFTALVRQSPSPPRLDPREDSRYRYLAANAGRKVREYFAGTRLPLESIAHEQTMMQP